MTDQEFHHIHNYILQNCEDIVPFERIFEMQVCGEFPNISATEMDDIKTDKFSPWLKYYVTSSPVMNDHRYTWLMELVGGPLSKAISSPMYCTRGYVFKKRPCSNYRKTVNHGVVVRTDSLDYYGEISDILEVEYPGVVNLKCVLFKCEWFDPTIDLGVRRTKFGVTEIHTGRRLNKYDPFILAGQADQVVYIPYPQVTGRHNPWVTVTQINPRSRVEGVQENDPLQQQGFTMPEHSQHSLDAIDHVNDDDEFPEQVYEDGSNDESGGEFCTDSDSLSSECSADSDDM